MKLNLVTATLAVVAAGALAFIYSQEPWTFLRVAGAVIGLPSLILLLISRIQLGRPFAVSAKAHVLVTSGIYSRIRNPIYIFGALIVVGVVLFIDRPILLALLLVIVPLQIYRARKEERILAAAFGEQYARYKENCWL